MYCISANYASVLTGIQRSFKQEIVNQKNMGSSKGKNLLRKTFDTPPEWKCNLIFFEPDFKLKNNYSHINEKGEVPAKNKV